LQKKKGSFLYFQFSLIMTMHSSVSSSPLGLPACEKDAKALQFIEEMTRNADSVQEKVLAEILSQNANTEYLQRFELGGAFKSKMPIATYDEIQPDIQRIANGDRSPIFSSHPISEFLTRDICKDSGWKKMKCS
ncbi:hypothetical protein AABB24_023786, partial [Solanum stoloniferum]